MFGNGRRDNGWAVVVSFSYFILPNPSESTDNGVLTFSFSYGLIDGQYGFLGLLDRS